MIRPLQPGSPQDRFCDLIQSGLSIGEAARAVEKSHSIATNWLRRKAVRARLKDFLPLKHEPKPTRVTEANRIIREAAAKGWGAGRTITALAEQGITRTRRQVYHVRHQAKNRGMNQSAAPAKLCEALPRGVSPSDLDDLALRNGGPDAVTNRITRFLSAAGGVKLPARAADVAAAFSEVTPADVREIVRAVVRRAKAGDVAAARLVLDHLKPPA